MKPDKDDPGILPKETPPVVPTHSLIAKIIETLDYYFIAISGNAHGVSDAHGCNLKGLATHSPVLGVGEARGLLTIHMVLQIISV